MRIAVVGAGIAGLAFASAMCGDADIHLFDQMREPKPAGAGIILYPNGSDALQALNILPSVVRGAAQIRTMKHNRYGTTEEINLAQVWRDSNHTTLGARRSELHSILRMFVENAPHVSLKYGSTVEGVTLGSDSATLLSADGNGSTNFDLVVAADGVKSRLRHTFFPDSRPVKTGLIYCRFIARNVLGLTTEWIVVDEQHASYGIYPVGEGLLHSHIMFRGDSIPCQRGEEVTYLSELCGRWNEQIKSVFQARTTDVHVSMASMVRPAKWGQGRCVIIGDAAHSISPTLSEGGSLALEDGIVLAKCLKNSTNVNDAIDRFVALRDEVVTWALRMATAQVRAPIRSSASISTDPKHSIAHMQRMYAPFTRTAHIFTL